MTDQPTMVFCKNCRNYVGFCGSGDELPGFGVQNVPQVWLCLVPQTYYDPINGKQTAPHNALEKNQHCDCGDYVEKERP